MIKNLLSIVALFLLSTIGLYAANGTVSITTMPTTIEAGTNGAFSINYTSDVACKLNVAIFKTIAGTTNPDWSTWQAQMDVPALAIASTATNVNFNFAVPANLAASSTLPAGVSYIWTLKLVSTVGGTEYAYNNSGNGNLLTITPSTVVANIIAFTTTPKATVKQGEQVTIDIEYTLTAVSNVKVALATYTAAGAYVSDVIVSTLENEPATTTTKVTKHIAITIPANAVISSTLSGQVHKWDIGIYTPAPAWGYITSSKSNAEITVSTDVSNRNTQKSSVMGSTGYVSINDAEGQEIQIYNLSGTSIKKSVAQSSKEEIALPKGLYLVAVGSQTTKVIVK